MSDIVVQADLTALQTFIQKLTQLQNDLDGDRSYVVTAYNAFDGSLQGGNKADLQQDFGQLCTDLNNSDTLITQILQGLNKLYNDLQALQSIQY